MTSSYFILKALHVTGVVVFLGNIIVTAWWKIAADRTRDPTTIAYAQRQVTVTDFIFTATGAALIVGAGDAMAYGYYSDSWSVPWIFWGRVLFFSVGAIWLFVLIPIQVWQARLARAFAHGGVISRRYWVLGRIWIIAGLVAIVVSRQPGSSSSSHRPSGLHRERRGSTFQPPSGPPACQAQCGPSMLTV